MSEETENKITIDNIITGEIPFFIFREHPVYQSLESGVHSVQTILLKIEHDTGYEEDLYFILCETNSARKFIVTDDFILFVTNKGNIYKVRSDGGTIYQLMKRGLKRLVLADIHHLYVEKKENGKFLLQFDGNGKQLQTETDVVREDNILAYFYLYQ